MYLTMISAEKKKAVIANLQVHKTDVGSPAVQTGIQTNRIAELTEHLKVHKKDFAARRRLLQLVGQRKRLLRYVSDKDSKDYLDLIKRLGIRK